MPCDKVVDIGQGLAHISSQSHKESILVLISIFFSVVSWSVRLPYEENVIWSDLRIILAILNYNGLWTFYGVYVIYQAAIPEM